jgi:hypothetical protein
MPTKNTIERARQDARQGKAPGTQAGEFVHEEIDHIREGKHGAKSAKQAIAIGLSKARRAGVKLAAPRKGATSEATRRKAKRDASGNMTVGKRTAASKGARKPAAPSRRRSRATLVALKRSGSAAASPRALSRQAKEASARRPRPSGSRRPAKRRAKAQPAQAR